MIHHNPGKLTISQVTKMQLQKIYGKGKEAKAFIAELVKGHWV